MYFEQNAIDNHVKKLSVFIHPDKVSEEEVSR
jgi:hypothetical protein